MAKWLREYKWHIIAALLITGAAAALWGWIDDRQTAELAILQKELAQNERELQAAGKVNEELRVQLARKQTEIKQLQQNNDRRIREVTVNAYKKARSLGDNDLLAAYNRLITGARSRNALRDRADTGSEE